MNSSLSPTTTLPWKSEHCAYVGDTRISFIVPSAAQRTLEDSPGGFEYALAGLATARHKGTRLGRPRVFISRSRIESLRQAGKSWREIAMELDANTATARRAYAAELEP